MPSRKSRNTRKKRPSRLRLVILSLVSIILLAIIGGGIFVGIVALHTPKWDPSTLSNQQQTSYIYDKNNVQVAQLYGVVNRQVVQSSQIPDLVKKTFVAVEDKRFYQHFGIDPIRIIGSALNDIRSGSAKEGASTITVQLARNAFIEDPTAKTLTRKIQEAIIALQLEHEYTKDEILTFYLNKIFLGESSFGIQAAAKTYFGEDLKDLTPDQIALLAGLPQAPSQYNPYIHPEAAKNRRTIVLGVMKDAGLITASQYNEYKDAPFTYVDSKKKQGGAGNTTTVSSTNYKYPYFIDYVVEELETAYNLTPDQIYSGGLKIYTTIDTKIQSAAESAFADPANFPKGIDNTKIQGAMTVIDPTSGGILAMVGGRDYTTRGLNRAWQSKRQPGSTIKPLVVYGPAIEKGGYFPGTVLDDMPVSYNGGNGKAWTPTDFDTIDKGWKGLITMRYALEDSVNVYAVKLLNLIGVDYGWKFGKDDLGLPLEQKDKVLSLALGTPEVSTLDMASAYGVYANNGVKVTTHAIVKVNDANDNTIITPKILKNRVMKETTAYIINNMLRSVVTDGTGYSAQIGNWAIAGKTGTTSLDPDKYGNKSGNPDAWFAGYTPNFAGIVWMGYDSDPDGQHYLHNVYGGSYPAQIWKKVMTVALQDLPVQTEFKEPAGIVSGQFDTKSGLLPSTLTPQQFISTEIAAQGDFPTRVSDVWVQKNVDADNPNVLANAATKNVVTKVFLNLPDRSPSWPWPPSEAPYRPPSGIGLDNTTAPGSTTQNTAPDSTNPDSTPANSAAANSSGSNSNTAPQVDPTLSTLPKPALGQVKYDPKTYTAVIPMTIPANSENDSTIFYLQRSGQSTVESFSINASHTQKTSISISLADNGKPPIPGDYLFWAAFKNPNGTGVGPSSDSVKLTITD
ncbi:penicillin-binding protein, 1A family [Desulfosporosinus acidiphilus SJ4]|uniref:Penicillin-binding protein 1A n=1 Tax=Desulfosporosinus acidiphilus (strain DSM 22704 / JCM 16185 / SJ4) TaxID=646529 RepID=I4D0B8_DESAJ|nr:PBP1A family penicillin-binding protein [Desulfosporosinus acidiphilus]AFM39242.1 penicillin-binding protein, 1A family [Desulfosporosinus acidiphilus SJ4]